MLRPDMPAYVLGPEIPDPDVTADPVTTTRHGNLLVRIRRLPA